MVYIVYHFTLSLSFSLLSSQPLKLWITPQSQIVTFNIHHYLCQSCIVPLGQIMALCSSTVPILAFPAVTDWPLSFARATGSPGLMFVGWFNGRKLYASQLNNLWHCGSVCVCV